MGGKIGEGGCTVRAISVWSGFSWREVWARLKALRVSLVRLREGLAHISHTESCTGRNHDFPCITDMAIQVLLSVSAQQVCTSPSAKQRVTLVLLNLIVQHTEKVSVLIPQAASAHDFFTSYPAHSIPLKKSLLARIRCLCWTQLCDCPASLCVCGPSFLCGTGWSRPAPTGKHQFWKPWGNFSGLLKSFSHPKHHL